MKKQGRKRRKFSLRLKITLLSTLILVCVTLAMSLMSIFNVDRYFVRNMDKTANLIKTENIHLGAEAQIVPLATTAPSVSITGVADGQPIGSGDCSYTITGENPMEERQDGNTIEPVTGTVEAVAMFTVAVNHGRKNFTFITWVLTGLVIFIGAAAVYFFAGRALKPVRQLSDRMKTVDEDALSERVVIKETSAEISNLAQSFNHMLDRLNNAFEMQKNFAVNAAHELKTPLSCMQTNLEVLELDDNPTMEDYRALADVTRRNTQRLVRLVDDLLKMNSQNSAAGEPVHMEELAAHAARELEPVRKEKQVSISCSGEGTAKGNGALYYRALFNLMENAVKYNKPGGHIWVEVSQTPDTVQVVVRDDGVGISKEDCLHIFEPFYRVEKSRSREIAGSGLGLSIVKSIVEKHQGTLSVRSDQEGTDKGTNEGPYDGTNEGANQGTQFTMELPAFQPED